MYGCILVVTFLLLAILLVARQKEWVNAATVILINQETVKAYVAFYYLSLLVTSSRNCDPMY